MIPDRFSIVNLPDGKRSLRSLGHGETFHPGIGPMEEAKILHTDQHDFPKRTKGRNPFILWDVGLGAAANTISALEVLMSLEADIEIHSFDISTAPLEFSLLNLDSLTYLKKYEHILRALLREKSVQVRNGLRWYFHLGDFREKLQVPSLPSPHSIFYDPYSPGTNREMWTLPHFQILAQRMQKDCLFTNYTRSTSVRVTLLLSDLFVGKGVSIGTKEETTIASPCRELIQNPLNSKWLEKVKISGNAAPIRSLSTADAPIDWEDYNQLHWHQQFSPRPTMSERSYSLP